MKWRDQGWGIDAPCGRNRICLYNPEKGQIVGRLYLPGGLASDPIKVELHRKQGRRALYADAEDPGFWANLNLEGVHTVMLAMPELEAKLLATRQLRKHGYKGSISTTIVFDEELEPLKSAGADYVFNYYDGIGSSFAQNTIAQLD